jgi:hypothetical protein
MRIAPGKVVDGRVELDGELPEGTAVTVLAPEGDGTFEADPETEKMLLQAIEQANRGQTRPLTMSSATSVGASEPSVHHQRHRSRRGATSVRPRLVAGQSSEGPERRPRRI